MNIEMTHIEKSFGSNEVLKDVSFELKEGEVHALMGENGAGKSTLMNILTGLHEKDSGLIKINGSEIIYDNPKEAENNGVSFIHQEMITWPEMKVIDNMFMGKELTSKFSWLNMAKMKKKASNILSELEVNIPLDKTMKALSVGEQQLIEIAKTLMNNAEVIIMDEPTAALTDSEIKVLFRIIRKLKTSGVSIVYISHRMEEIFEICDRVTVMRDGLSIETNLIENTSEKEIVKQMVGRDIDDFYPSQDNRTDDVLLELDNISTDKIKDISFKLHSGEILGFSGLMGAGRTEIARAIFGMDTVQDGNFYLEGKKVNLTSPTNAKSYGIGFLTENRKEEGLILDFSVKDNIALTSLGEFSKYGWINTREEEDFVDLLIKRLTVKTENRYLPVKSLSGGNQQKVVFAKWIGSGTRILILDEPTRGVDVGAKREIYNLMNELTERGVGIIMISSDLPEVINISNRVCVVHEGSIAGIVEGTDINEEKIMTLATGGK